MFASNSSPKENIEFSEDIIELNEGNSGRYFKNKIITNDTVLSVDCKTVENEDKVSYKQNMSSKEKESENEDNESVETTSLIYPFSTLRLPKISSATMEEHVKIIANHIKRKNKLMKNDAVLELMRLEMIRNMPQSLTLKRAVKAKLLLSENKKSKSKPIGYWKRMRYQLSMSMSKVKINFCQIGSSLELWYNSIKVIEGHFGSGIATYFKFLRWLFIINTIGFIFSNLFITLPQALVESHHYERFSGWEILLGNGIFTNSIFYYGFYFNHTLMIDSQFAYDIPAVYFLTFLFCYFFTFILLCFKLARSYKKCYIETSGGAHNRYANKIFCSWDWGISSYKAASLRSSSIYRELEELLCETKNSSLPVSCSMRIWTFLIRLAMTTLIISVVCGTGIFLWLLLHIYKTDDSDTMSILIVPVIITLIINLIPPLISWSVKYEMYSKDRTAFYITMIRVYAIAVIAVATLLTFYLTQNTLVGCWQTKLAQEIYRLIFLDLFVSVFGVFLIQYARSLKPLRRKFGSPTFDVAHNTLNLIYNQSLFWLVHYFSPPMSIVVLGKLFLTFYVKKYELLKCCEPPQKFWRAAQTQTLFLALTLLGMISALVVLGHVIIYVNTGSCGPFAGRDYTWEVIVEEVLNISRNSAFWNFFESIANPATGFVLLILMCIAVYFLKAKAEASKQMVQILREMLVWQARDKEFLMKSFTSATDRNWLRHRRFLGVATINDAHNSNHDRPRVNEPSTSY